MAQTIQMKLSKEEFPNVIQADGTAAGQIAAEMAHKMGIQNPTEVDLNSILINLESDLAEQNLLTGLENPEQLEQEND